MKICTLLMLSPLLVPAVTCASTVIYTDSRHPPSNTDTSVTVIYLDGPAQLQAQMFGPLSSQPDDAERQVNAVLRSPHWPEQSQQLAGAYRAVVHAWALGIKKVPAVVFDDRDVVYGTADVAQAEAWGARARGGQ